MFDALQDPEVKLSERYQDFLWFVQPREAAVCLNAAWENRLQVALNETYVFIGDGDSQTDHAEVIDRYEVTLAPVDQEDSATVPNTADEVPEEYCESCSVAGSEDVAVVPGDEESGAIGFYGEMEMYTDTTSAAFDFTKPGHGGSFMGLGNQFEESGKPWSENPSYYRAISNESGYNSDDTFTFSILWVRCDIKQKLHYFLTFSKV